MKAFFSIIKILPMLFQAIGGVIDYFKRKADERAKRKLEDEIRKRMELPPRDPRGNIDDLF